MSIKPIIRLSFGLKSQNIRFIGASDATDLLDFSDEKTPQYLSFRGCIELHDWKGI